MQDELGFFIIRTNIRPIFNQYILLIFIMIIPIHAVDRSLLSVTQSLQGYQLKRSMRKHGALGFRRPPDINLTFDGFL